MMTAQISRPSDGIQTKWWLCAPHPDSGPHTADIKIDRRKVRLVFVPYIVHDSGIRVITITTIKSRLHISNGECHTTAAPTITPIIKNNLRDAANDWVKWPRRRRRTQRSGAVECCLIIFFFLHFAFFCVKTALVLLPPLTALPLPCPLFGRFYCLSLAWAFEEVYFYLL